MAILKKVSGVYQDIGGLSKKVSGVVSDVDSAWVKENGVWVEKWANWKETLLENYTIANGTIGYEVSRTVNLPVTKKQCETAMAKGYQLLRLKCHFSNSNYQGIYWTLQLKNGNTVFSTLVDDGTVSSGVKDTSLSCYSQRVIDTIFSPTDTLSLYLSARRSYGSGDTYALIINSLKFEN